MQTQPNNRLSIVLEYISSFLIKVNVETKDDFRLQNISSKENEISPEILVESIGVLTQQLEAVCEQIKFVMKDKMYNVSQMDTTNPVQEKTVTVDCEQVVKADCESHPIDPSIVQIKASNAEIERRIAAFLDQKQSEVNEFNRREFCSWTQLDDKYNEGCARTEAIFVPRAGTKSHIKLTRVVNPYGPQTRQQDIGNSQSTSQAQQANAGTGLQCMHERLKNIENHLDMTEESSKTDMFQRLKVLEERILYLEGLSPEYFQNAPPPVRRKRRKVEEQSNQNDPHTEIPLADIDAKIQRLKASLKQQACGESFD
ncbi:MAP3K12-binding inhibitory protein 1-like [Gigantopelta aegis]|uniref:MAP3K12-binding inhibitory protein 1-like n=1 Tax=Gigantopelta aegis TaxID=1735272 RepID=UPI001B88BE9F|nr:MAP3K12-binding inhibitory protein 1-like [Gigantopelta aegis]